MAPSAQTPNIFLFTDLRAGEQHGYIYDRWTDDAHTRFEYTGEGQQGDQTMTGGNRATLEHRETGRALRLFDGARGTVRYIGEFELGDPPHQVRDAPPSGGGPPRKVIVFNLKPLTTSEAGFRGEYGSGLSALNDELCLPSGYLSDVDWLLNDKKQIVFYGPPGTGKTYVAERFAEWFTSGIGNVEVIQFHPSYAYEDFVEGIRPALDAEDLHYRLVPGLLRAFAQRCLDDPSARFVLVIDEINRANLARVFGELLYLLEYRQKGVTLPYSQEGFQLPENLYIIGTMNTADRSIALVDFALRRRFHFVHFAADPSILRRWLQRHVPSMTSVADYLEFVNERLGQSDFAVGFSYFMRTDLDESVLRRLWERSVLPALGEYYFNDPEQVAALGLDEVRSALTAKDAAAQFEAAEVETGLPVPSGDGGAGEP
jgi:hypothetical protein